MSDNMQNPRVGTPGKILTQTASESQVFNNKKNGNKTPL